MLRFIGPPSWWVNRGGAPARCLGTPASPIYGLPSYVHDDGDLVVYDIVVAMCGPDGQVRLFSRWYGTACVLAPDGLVPLHHTGPDLELLSKEPLFALEVHNPGAWWEWRPQLYRLTAWGTWEALGSQGELAYRHGLNWAVSNHAAIEAGEDAEPFGMPDAYDRAEALLRDCLTPAQLCDYVLSAHTTFRVRGAETDHLYEVQIGDGFCRVDEATGEPVESFCLHPEAWMPDDDVALATKFALEDPEREAECIAGARRRDLGPPPRPTASQLRAAQMERELL